jgi:hypothetical protein
MIQTVEVYLDRDEPTQDNTIPIAVPSRFVVGYRHGYSLLAALRLVLLAGSPNPSIRTVAVGAILGMVTIHLDSILTWDWTIDDLLFYDDIFS